MTPQAGIQDKIGALARVIAGLFGCDLDAGPFDRTVFAKTQRAGNGKKRKDRQHRDDCDVLRQKNGKRGAAAAGLHQVLFVQRLKNDSGG